MMKKLVGWLSCAIIAATWCGRAGAAEAEVSGVFGVATAQVSGEAEQPLQPGMKLKAGTIIRTAPRAAADIFLGGDAGVIRLTQNTMVTLAELDRSENASTYLNLQHGAILGNGSKVRLGSRYQVKTSTGIAAIGNAAFRLHAEGYFVVVDGRAQFAHVQSEGQPRVHVLSTPPAVYFSPTEGVKEAPRALVREVINQSKARLGSNIPEPK